MRATLESGQPFHCEYPCDSPTTKRWYELVAARMVDRGKTYLIVQHRNITARHVELDAVERAFVDTSAMAALVAGTYDAILSYDLEGRIITWNPAAEALYGYTHDEVIGKSLEILYPPNWPTRIQQYRDEIIAGRLSRFEATRIAKDGTPREVWISCAPIRSSAGEVVAISNIHRDVTEIRKAEKAREIIAGEVIHRAKNMLSIVSAIQRQTARVETTLEGFHRSFGARVQALARSTDLLVNGTWTTVRLDNVIREHLDPFLEPSDERVALSGPPTELQPQAVQTIGMAIHELATNAAKYGALAGDDARIDITWTVEHASDTPQLTIEWHETAAVEPQPEGRTGFGSTVLKSLVPSMLDGQSALDFQQDAVRWTIVIPSQHFSIGKAA